MISGEIVTLLALACDVVGFRATPSGDSFWSTTIWKQLLGDDHLETPSGRRPSGDDFRATTIWRQRLGDDYLETASGRRPSERQSLWRDL